MGYEITVDLISTTSENGRVLETLVRPLRELPDGSLGINYRREIYPLHAFDGVSGHVHIGGKTFDPDLCPVFEGEPEVAQKKVVRGIVDFSGHYDYVLLSCDEQTLGTILNDIEDQGIDIGKFGESVKPASNGKIYDHWARLVGWNRSASELAILIADVDESNLGYSVVFDDVFERRVEESSHPDSLPASDVEPTTRTNREPENTNDLLALSRNTDRLIRGLRTAGWATHDLNELSDQLAAHGMSAINKKRSTEDDEWLENVSVERAVIIGKWSKKRLESLADEITPRLDESKNDFADLEKKYEAVKIELHRIRERPQISYSGDSDESYKKIDALEAELSKSKSDQETWFKEHERVSDELDDTKELLASAMSQIDQWKALSAKANAGSETVGDFLGTLLPKIELLRDSESFLSFQLVDRTHVLRDLKTINDSGVHHRAKTLSGIRGWSEIHFSTGQADNGRLYFRKVGDKVRAMLSWKKDQDRVIQQLRRL